MCHGKNWNPWTTLVITHYFKYSLGFGWPCINFRDDFECFGTPISTETHLLLTYDNCAKECIGTPGCISFNWEYKLSYGSVSQCVLYSSGGFSTSCFNPSCHPRVCLSLGGFPKTWFWLAGSAFNSDSIGKPLQCHRAHQNLQRTQKLMEMV